MSTQDEQFEKLSKIKGPYKFSFTQKRNNCFKVIDIYDSLIDDESFLAVEINEETQTIICEEIEKSKLYFILISKNVLSSDEVNVFIKNCACDDCVGSITIH